MTQNIFLSSRGDKYRTRILAEKNLPDGYEIAGDDETGFYGVPKETEETKDTDDIETDTGKDIICPLCGACHFETTEDFDPDKHVHPGMLRLKEPYLSYGWEPPPPDPSAGSGSLECRECGGLLAPEGRFKLG